MISIEDEMRQSRQATDTITTPRPLKYAEPYGVYQPQAQQSVQPQRTYNNELLSERQQSRQAAQDIVGPPLPESLKRKREAVKDIYARLLEQENSKTDPNGGWNEKEQRWYPHKSQEGGAQTVAYGIKLSNGTKWAKKAKEQGYLTDEEAQEAAMEMSEDSYDRAKEIYNKHIKTEKGVENAWDKLNHKEQSILADYAYQYLLDDYKNLMDATYAGDIEGMKAESKRYFYKNNVKHELEKRNPRMLRDIDSLQTHYPITPGE